MSELKIYRDSDQGAPEFIEDHEQIARELATVGIRFERWSASVELTRDSSQNEILSAYDSCIQPLMAESGFQTADVISMHPEHPQKTQLREKFLSEHIHTDDEVRFFVYGAGLFYLHIKGSVYGVLCNQGDLISVPANTKHWFDMGPNPDFKCIRLFSNEEGWVAQMTGDSIAERYPRFE